MALFKSVTTVDANGNTSQVQGGIFHKVESKIDPSGTMCVTKKDVFGVSEDTTCFQTPNVVVKK